jgi:hypothetical protein
MFDATTIGKWIFFAGLIVMVIGGVVWLAGRFGLPLGRLPGDLRIERDGLSFYFPLTTGLLLSLGLTLLLNLAVRLFNFFNHR